jgi:A/G-specific adenine glycosylase
VIHSPRKTSSFGAALLAWDRTQKRALPWQGTHDPYAVWVSEIMLAQTRVATVIPYYKKFLTSFPDLHSLAASRVERVLKVWEGLGYYARARNLHKAAQMVLSDFGGRFPRRAADWETLPGVGRYTAAAIAAFAFQEETPALDANVRRILSRVFLFRGVPTSPRAESKLGNLYLHTRGTRRPGIFLQALMDLGQTICLPRDPHCGDCPVAKYCQAQARGWQNKLPRRTPSRRLPHYQVAAAVIERQGKVLLAKRRPEALLGGMWEFPGGKRERGETLPACLQRELREELGVRVSVCERLMKIPHAFSHFRITLHVFRCNSLRGHPRPLEAADVRWIRIADLEQYPMGKADRIAASWLTKERKK